MTSLSVDLHKYGYADKGASVVLYRDAELRRHQYFAHAGWPGYPVVNPTVQGTKSGGPLAQAWAVLRYVGEDGYTALAGRVAEASDRLLAGLRAIPGYGSSATRPPGSSPSPSWAATARTRTAAGPI